MSSLQIFLIKLPVQPVKELTFYIGNWEQTHVGVWNPFRFSYISQTGVHESGGCGPDHLSSMSNLHK